MPLCERCPEFSQQMHSGGVFPEFSVQVSYFFDPDLLRSSGLALQKKMTGEIFGGSQMRLNQRYYLYVIDRNVGGVKKKWTRKVVFRIL